MSYDPLYTLLFVPAMLWRGGWRAIAVCATLWLLHYGIGAVEAGPNWPLDLLDALAG